MSSTNKEERLSDLEKKVNELQYSKIGSIRNLIREIGKARRGEKGADIESAMIGVANAYFRRVYLITLGSLLIGILAIAEFILIYNQTSILNRQTQIMQSGNDFSSFKAYNEIKTFILANTIDSIPTPYPINSSIDYETEPSIGSLDQLSDLVSTQPNSYYKTLVNLLNDPSSTVRLASIYTLNKNFPDSCSKLDVVLNRMYFTSSILNNISARNIELIQVLGECQFRKEIAMLTIKSSLLFTLSTINANIHFLNLRDNLIFSTFGNTRSISETYAYNNLLYSASTDIVCSLQQNSYDTLGIYLDTSHNYLLDAYPDRYHRRFVNFNQFMYHLLRNSRYKNPQHAIFSDFDLKELLADFNEYDKNRTFIYPPSDSSYLLVHPKITIFGDSWLPLEFINYDEGLINYDTLNCERQYKAFERIKDINQNEMP